MVRRNRMFTVTVACAFLSVVLVKSAVAQQIPHELNVRVTFDKNDAPAPAHLRVQLLNRAGIQVNELLTNDQGIVYFGAVAAGGYRVKVSGPGIEDIPDPYPFTIDANEMSHTEYVRIRRSIPSNGTGRGATVSAAEISVPEPARKEYSKGTSDFNSQEFSAAEKHFLKAAELYPSYSAAFNALGSLAMKAGDSDRALTYFQKAVTSDDKNASAYINLGKVYANKNKPDAMERSLAKAVALEPSNPEALSLLANAELALGKPDQALANARKVHNVAHEKFSFCHLVAAKALEQKNMRAEAITEYKLYLKEVPSGRQSDQVREYLRALEKKSGK